MTVFEIRDYEYMAMLDLRDSERELLRKRLEELSENFGALERIETDGVPPLVTVLNTKNIMREDFAEKPFSRDEILANAPEQYDGYFRVPATLE